jgi:hypothetical protein
MEEPDRFLAPWFTDRGDFDVPLLKQFQKSRARKALVPFSRLRQSGPFLGQEMLWNLVFNHGAYDARALRARE